MHLSLCEKFINYKFIIILKRENILMLGEREGRREDDNNLIIILSKWKHQRYVRMGGMTIN